MSEESPITRALNAERERCLMIAAYEAHYWKEVSAVDTNRPEMDGICIGLCGIQ